MMYNRDGVSEGQFNEVVTGELQKIKGLSNKSAMMAA